MFRTRISFHSEELLDPRPTPKLEDHPSAAVRDCLFNIYIGGRDSSVGIETGYGLLVRGSNPGGDKIFRTRPDRPWGPPRLLYDGYRVFHGGKVAGA
jgi:hypothetical protein